MPQTATILVTDVVDSTRLRVALGEERADELRRAHDGLLTDVVTGNGGEVVKGLGDGVLAMFSGAAEAVAAAVAIQQRIADHVDRNPSDQLSVRIGISAGDVTLEDDDCFGTPVVEASRLCAEAGGDEILVADLVRLLARGRGDHEFVPAGVRELKGLPEPVPVAVVSWARAARGGAPLPNALRAGQWFDFAGREAERELLLGRWKAAAAGEPGLVVVSGEPGIGKTRLVAELAAQANDTGATVLYGRSEEELDVPYRPWAEGLQHLVTHLAPEILAAHIEGWGTDIGRLSPAVAEPPPPSSDPDSERLGLFGAVLDLLRRAGEEAPVLVVLDDLHWADESSLLLLRHLVRHRGEARFLLVGTYRDTDLARSHPLAATLADLRREAGVQRVPLMGLTPDEVTDLITLAGGEVVPEDAAELAGMVTAETEGNPFFIGEVLVHLVESGALVQRDGRWHGDRSLIEQIGLPEGIREVIGRRLGDLPATTDELLRAAAVVGPAFDAAVVAAALDRDVDDVVIGLDDAVGRRLVVEDGLDRYRFAHALVRQTLLEEVSTSRRVRLHHRIALSLEERNAPTADLAHHFGESMALADADRAMAHAGRAADQATSQLAYEQAVAFRRLAVEAEELIDPADPARRAEVLLALGDARNQAGRPVDGLADFVAAADAARQAGRPDLLARAAIDYGFMQAAWLDFADTVGPALLDEALVALPPVPSPLRAQALAKRCMWRVLDLDPTVRLDQARAAGAMADETGDRDALHLSLDAQVGVFMWAGELAEMLLVVDRFEELAERWDDDPLRFQTTYQRYTAQLIGDDLDAARSTLSELAAFDFDRLTVANRLNFVAISTSLANLEGRWADIERLDAEEMGSFGMTGPGLELAQRMGLAAGTGDLEAAADLAWEQATEFGDQFVIWPNRAWAAWFRGDAEVALHELRQWYEGIFPFVPATFRRHVAGTAVHIAVELGASEMFEGLSAEFRGHRGQWATWCGEVAQFLVDHVLGVLDLAFGDPALGEEELRSAVAAYRRNGARARLTEALGDVAVMLDDAEARAEAIALSEELGMKGQLLRLGA